MRPIRLEICGWGPYASKEVIHFTGLNGKGVFLITGPTGGGKTSIFDAISYALYGDVSGRNRDKTSIRSDFALPETETYVKLKFEHKGKIYDIFRAPSYERPKKRGEGFTLSLEEAEILGEDILPAGTVTEVNKRVEELLRLDYSQFKQTAMIAQGEFLELLFAGSKSRVEIFRKLFQTQMYDRLQRRLTKDTLELDAQLKELNAKMEEAKNSILSEENAELTELLSAEYVDYDALKKALKKDISSYKKQQEAAEAKLIHLEEAQAKISNWQIVYKKLVEEEKTLTTQLATLERELPQKRTILDELKEKEQTLETRYQEKRKGLELQQKELEKEAKDIAGQLKRLSNIEKQLTDVSLSLQKEHHVYQDWEEGKKIYNRMDEQAKVLKGAQESYAREQALMQEKKDVYEQLEEKYRNAAVGLVAATLKEGEPCPVCGS
nr:SMC family ATPase [Lachnospiraceae bacterium]